MIKHGKQGKNINKKVKIEWLNKCLFVFDCLWLKIVYKYLIRIHVNLVSIN